MFLICKPFTKITRATPKVKNRFFYSAWYMLRHIEEYRKILLHLNLEMQHPVRRMSFIYNVIGVIFQ